MCRVSISRVLAGWVVMSHTGSAAIPWAASRQLPSMRRPAAAMTCSRRCSAGATKTRRSCASTRRRKALDMAETRRLGSARCWQRRGSSRRRVDTRKHASTRSRLRCMWKGTCRRRSTFSCSGLRSPYRCELSPWARSSRWRLEPHTSASAAWHSAKRPWWKAATPRRARARLKRICVGTSEKPMDSCTWLMSTRSRASANRSWRAWWKVWRSSARVRARSSPCAYTRAVSSAMAAPTSRTSGSVMASTAAVAASLADSSPPPCARCASASAAPLRLAASAHWASYRVWGL
mmetsp:Transcript_10849/g.36862  ORF Transcript_10849/g.36862 Transcript_10849/m.36862 type:complete len:291 (-) Transcript_10849:42-914(-)